jgi:GMP synthase (glutamine-hydrolysing)
MADQQPRFLLITTRLEEFMQNHELDCLVRAGGLKKEQFRILDATREAVSEELYQQFEAVFIGGTGDFSVAQDRPEWFEQLSKWTAGLLERGVPSLGLCYGFHLMAHAMGGEVKTRPDLEETGTFEIRLTEEGREDEILKCLPGYFLAQQGHHDVVMTMPDGWIRLADSQRCHWQAFKHPEKPFYGLQFHPELRKEDFMDRMRAYAGSYASTPEIFEEINKQVKQTHNEEVIINFLKLVEETRTQGK